MEYFPYIPSKTYLQNFGIDVDVDKMLLIPGRILPSPEIKLKLSDIDQQDIFEGVQIGRWSLNVLLDDCQQPIRTAKPMLYQVLYDEIGFTSNEIQILTRYLCYNGARTIVVPLPIQYCLYNSVYYINAAQNKDIRDE